MHSRFDPTILHNLTQFNHGLVYGFQPESSTNEQLGRASLEEMLRCSTGQYEDLFLAYQYLQDSVLPQLDEHGLDGVDETVFLGWMKTVHRLIAKSLTEANYSDPQDPHSQGAGSYTQDFIIRWRVPNEIMTLLYNYIIGTMSNKIAAQNLQLEFGIKKADAMAFLQSIDCAKKCPNIILAQSERDWLDRFSEGGPEYFYTMSKLAVLYHGKSQKLTEAHRQAIYVVAQLGLPPTLISAKMKELATNTVNKWKELQLELAGVEPNVKKIASFLTEFFSEFNKIHPFENANKRTSCCIMNLMLRSFKLPSILVKLPQEYLEEKPVSSAAFKSMDTNLLPMMKLIESRIQQELRQPFSHPRMQEFNRLQCRKADLILTIIAQYPKYNVVHALGSIPRIPQIINKQLSKFDQQIESQISSEETTISFLSKWLQDLDNKAARPKTDLSLAGTLFQAPESIEDSVRSKLEQVSSVKLWKKKGSDRELQLWREFESKEEAVTTHEVLSKYKTMMEVTLSKRADNQKNVILCKNIQIDAFLKSSLVSTEVAQAIKTAQDTEATQATEAATI
jgi:prophage maintenance system killer protein